MDLVLDVGNSGIKGGLFRGEDLLETFRVETDEKKSRGTNAIRARTQEVIQEVLRERGGEPIRRCGILSVVPRLTAPLTETLTELLSELEEPPVRLRAEGGGPIEPGYASMDTLGVDRFAAACGGYLRAGAGPVVVVDAGTAITTEVVDAEGRYVGGSITAGPELILRALVEHTAQLEPISLEVPPRPIGHTTEDSLRTGILRGAVDGLEGAVRRYAHELGEPTAIYLTGGWAERLSTLMETAHQVHPHLVLEGGRALLNAHGEAG